MKRRIAALISGVLAVGCQPPESSFRLEDQPPGATVALVDADLWTTGTRTVRLTATFERPDAFASGPVAVAPNGLEVPLLPGAVPVGNSPRLVSSTALLPIPLAPAGVAEFPVVIRVGQNEVARWTVRRQVLDAQVTACVADQPAEVEELAAPLTKCHAYAAEDLEGGEVFLPFEATGAFVRKRVAISTRAGVVNASVLDSRKVLQSGSSSPAQVLTVSEGHPVEVVVDPWIRLTIGSFGMSPRGLNQRSLADLDPTPTTISVRVGSSFDLVREVRANRRPLELVSFDDELSQAVSLTSPLPLPIATAANTALNVRIAPRGPGPHGLVRLGLRDPNGVVLTDRIAFSVNDLPAATCRLSIDDVDVGAIRVGERRMIDVAIRNVGTDPCTKARVAFDAEAPERLKLTWQAGAMPTAGQTVMRRLGVEARSAGPQVRLMSVFFDELTPTQPDLVVRIDAAPTQ